MAEADPIQSTSNGKDQPENTVGIIKVLEMFLTYGFRAFLPLGEYK